MFWLHARWDEDYRCTHSFFCLCCAGYYDSWRNFFMTSTCTTASWTEKKNNSLCIISFKKTPQCFHFWWLHCPLHSLFIHFHSWIKSNLSWLVESLENETNKSSLIFIPLCMHPKRSHESLLIFKMAETWMHTSTKSSIYCNNHPRL